MNDLAASAARPRGPMRRLAMPASLAAAVLAVGMAACAGVRLPVDEALPHGPSRRLPLDTVETARDVGNTFAVVLTSDGPVNTTGGSVARDLAARGIPSVVWHSLQYYWHPRTPQEAAGDLDLVIRRYGARWHRQRVLLVGYSFGADVLPFLVNRLPAESRARVAGVVTIAMSHDAIFEFRIPVWWNHLDEPSLAVRPEVEGLAGLPALCIYALRDPNAACPLMRTSPMRVASIPGGHTIPPLYYRRVRRLLLDFAEQVEPSAALPRHRRHLHLHRRRTLLAPGQPDPSRSELPTAH